MTTYDVLEIICDIRVEEFSSRMPSIAPSEDFYYHSYCRWALDELEHYIWKHSNTKDIMYLLETYRQRMDDWSCLPNKPAETCWMFTVAYDMVTYIIDQVITVKSALGDFE